MKPRMEYFSGTGRSRRHGFTVVRHNEAGALTAAEIIAILFVFIALAGLGYPIVRQQLAEARAYAATTDVQALAREVQATIAQNSPWKPEKVNIEWDPTTQSLKIPVPGQPGEVIDRRLPLTVGTSLLPRGSEWGPDVNTISGSRDFCLAVVNDGHVAFQTGAGPTARCGD